MPLRRMYRPHLPRRMNAELREGEVVLPLELFFDLVVVLGFTQCTALMEHEASWAGIGRGMLVLALLWWAWTAYAWLTSVINPEEGAIRVAMFAAMAALLVAALCVPQALGDYALGFAVAYGVVRFAQIALYLLASRTDHELRRSVVGLAVGTTIGVGIILGAAFAPTGWREALWILALVLDFGEPAVFGIAGWKLSPAHFAERHGLIIIIALGESIVALGIASQVDLTAGVITAAVLGIALASALWWTYFDVVALVTARRLVQAPEGAVRNALARNSYSYLHLPMVAGIVLVALGLESTIAHVDDELHAYTAFALLGGVAIYLLAHVVLRWQNAHTLNRQRFALAVVLFALIPVATLVPALVTVAGVNVLIWAMVAYEHHQYDERRYRLRHGLDVDIPGEEGAARGS